MGDGVQCLRQEVRYVLQRVDLGHGMMTLHLAFAYDEFAPRNVPRLLRRDKVMHQCQPFLASTMSLVGASAITRYPIS